MDDCVPKRLLRRPPLGRRRLYLRLKLRLRLHLRRLLRRLRRLLRRLLLLRLRLRLPLLLLRLLLPLLRPRLKALMAVATAAARQAIRAAKVRTRVRTSRAMMIAEIRAMMALRYLRPVITLDLPVVVLVALVALDPPVAEAVEETLVVGLPMDLYLRGTTAYRVAMGPLVDLRIPGAGAAMVAAVVAEADRAAMYRVDGPLVVLVALAVVILYLRPWTPDMLTPAESIVDKPLC